MASHTSFLTCDENRNSKRKKQLFLEITNTPDGSGNIAIDSEADTLAFLLGRIVHEMDIRQSEGLWIIIADRVCNMYQRNL